tara:strand:+ start:543 stop:788 length:246 start_codon:yes stop_codon:yes gene_type:complete
MSKYSEDDQIEKYMKRQFCNICNVSIHKNMNKEFEYIGVVCSNCFRMSKKRYCLLVDKISKIRMEFILNEVENYKSQIEKD